MNENILEGQQSSSLLHSNEHLESKLVFSITTNSDFTYIMDWLEMQSKYVQKSEYYFFCESPYDAVQNDLGKSTNQHVHVIKADEEHYSRLSSVPFSKLAISDRQRLNNSFLTSQLMGSNETFLVHIDDDEILMNWPKQIAPQVKAIRFKLYEFRHEQSAIHNRNALPRRGYILRPRHVFFQILTNFCLKSVAPLGDYINGHRWSKCATRLDGSVLEIGNHEPLGLNDSEFLKNHSCTLIHFDGPSYEKFVCKWENKTNRPAPQQGLLSAKRQRMIEIYNSLATDKAKHDLFLRMHSLTRFQYRILRLFGIAQKWHHHTLEMPSKGSYNTCEK